ncbi:MAG: T9SS type A sorting domain-containing protein [Ignavibacteria bacterium]|nr:T9SS type A sorting domain-containing protein [Ignavibacteria bacterium]
MRYRSFPFLFAVLYAMGSSGVVAGPGDTTVVQTFTFDQRAPYDARFLFPPASKRFEKILMYYKLKCNPAQTPACGEWDYLTYTHAYQNTGRMDSALLSHPNFLVNGAPRDTLQYMRTASFRYAPYFERYVTRIDSAGTITRHTPGAGATRITLAAANSEMGGRIRLMIRASEIPALRDSINGLVLEVPVAGGTLKNLTMRMKNLARIADTDTLSLAAAGFESAPVLYRRTTSFASAGELRIPFHGSFKYDGGHLVIELSWDGNAGPETVISADVLDWNAALTAIATDDALSFAPVSYVDVPVTPFARIDTAVTVALWQFGDPLNQPRASSIFEANDAKGARVLNAHLPWSDGTVYWDAGAGGYDRIQKAAPADNYKGRWNHWAFTKNSSTGEMKVYLNGVLWHSGTAKTKAMRGIATFRIGTNGAASGNWYAGMVDDFAVWNVALDESAIRAAMARTPDASHPYASNLVAGFPFEEGAGTVARNTANGEGARIVGVASRVSASGERVKNFAGSTLRPLVALETGAFTTRIDSLFVLDSVQTTPMLIALFSDTLHPAVATDTLFRWPVMPRLTYDAAGRLIDSTMPPPDSTLIRVNRSYYGTPFEVVNRFEIGRFITPYGNNLDMGAGWTWVYDVTDFRPVLTDSVRLTAGNWQELLDMKFVMIEGTPARDVVKVQNMWNGDWALNAFATKVPPKTVDLDPAAKAWRLKVTTTGHQFSNATNCAEFCPKLHSVDVGGVRRFSWQIVQECAMNPLYPQGGTWIYDRAGWCPGMPAATKDLELTPFVSGSQATIDYNAEYDEFGNYVVETQLISYGAPNFSLDAAIVDIIAPNSYEMHKRFNPTCSRPRITIRNNGSTPLTSLDITYGPRGGNSKTHRWTGSLAFLAEQTIDLPAFPWGSWTGPNIFDVRLANPNGGSDEYAVNDAMNTQFQSVPVHKGTLVVNFKTNNAASENWYEILDADGNQVRMKSNFANNTINKDTLLLPPGCYDFILHDAGDDGISFWANNDGSGYLNFRIVGGTLWQSLMPDFGKEIRYSFRIEQATSVQPLASPEDFDVYPNPSQGTISVTVDLETPAPLYIELRDMLGRAVRSQNVEEGTAGQRTIAFPVDGVAPGSYLLTVFRNGQRLHTVNLRIVR